MRTELEHAVISTNNVLRDTARTMPTLILLRNCHPAYRGDYAKQLWEQGSITKEEAEEFSKFIK